MTDLYIGLAIMTLLMSVMFAVAILVTRKTPMWVVDGLAGLAVIAIAAYARYVWDATFIAKLFPFSNLIVIGNWIPLAAGLLAGLVWRRIGDQPAKFLGLGKGEYGSTPRKVFAAAVLFIAGFLFMAWPLFGQPPECGNDWQGDLCLQTTDATCSAAAGATLLQNYGVYASEQEMADLCLTRRGTNWKGLFRALSIKGREAGHRVEIMSTRAEALIEEFDAPCILQCELPLESDGSDMQYDMGGWVRGQPHSVVLLHIHHTQTQEIWIIADPSQTYPELWSRTDIEKLWHGQLLRLVPR